jgi:hypothetical protein
MCVVCLDTSSWRTSGTLNFHQSTLDLDTRINTKLDVMLSSTIAVPRGRRLAFESAVSVLIAASETAKPWVLVVFGELKISTLAEVNFAQGKVFIASNGTLFLDGIATFEAVVLGRDYPENNTIKEPSRRTCVIGTGTFNTLLRSIVRYEASLFEIFCNFSPRISFEFKQPLGIVIPSRLERGDDLPFLSTKLTLLIGLESFTANFESALQATWFGFVVKIQNINNKTALDLRIKSLSATNLILVGSIRISVANCYVYRLDILEGGTGAVHMTGGAIF